MQKIGAYHGVAGEGDDRYLFTDNQLKVALARWEQEGKLFFVTESTELMHVISQLNSEMENKNAELRQMGKWLKDAQTDLARQEQIISDYLLRTGTEKYKNWPKKMQAEAEKQEQPTNEYLLKTQSIRYLLRQIIRVVWAKGKSMVE